MSGTAIAGIVPAPGGRHELATVAEANPLVVRGIADLAAIDRAALAARERDKQLASADARDIALAKRIAAARAGFRSEVLGCDYALRQVVDTLRRVHIGELQVEDILRVTSTDRRQTGRLHTRMGHNLRTLEPLMEANVEDFLRLTDRRTSGAERDELREEIEGRRRKCVRLAPHAKGWVRNALARMFKDEDFERRFRRLVFDQGSEASPVNDELVKKWFDVLMQTLFARERMFLGMLHGFREAYPYTLEEVSRIFKVTVEEVREIEVRAIARLRARARVIGTHMGPHAGDA